MTTSTDNPVWAKLRDSAPSRIVGSWSLGTKDRLDLSRVVGATIRDTLIGVLRPLFKTQTPDKTAKPMKAHGLLLIQRKEKDSNKPSMWPIRIPLEPAERSPPHSRVPLRPAGQSPPYSRVADLPSSR